MLHSLEGLADRRTPPHYERLKPENTLFYQIVEKYWTAFQAELDAQGKNLPHFVAKEFDEFIQ